MRGKVRLGQIDRVLMFIIFVLQHLSNLSGDYIEYQIRDRFSSMRFLIEGDESAAYADSAYQSKSRVDLLSVRDIENRLIKRAYRNCPLSKEDNVFNQAHAGVRSAVGRERVFLVCLNYITLWERPIILA